MRKRFKTEFDIDLGGNAKYNRYMAHMLRRLETARIGKIVDIKHFDGNLKKFIQETYHYKGDKRDVRRTMPNNKLYFAICNVIVKRSRVFFVHQLNNTYPG
jgi:hypothetical protein